MSEATHRFVDISGMPPKTPEVWAPVRVPAERIASEIERLASAPKPADGRRAASIVHPRSTLPGEGFSPGIDITINVLLPGEWTVPLRRNSNQVEFCIRGQGTLTAGADVARVGKWDVTTIPSMVPYSHHNDGDEIWVRLSYSNAPLLEKLGVHFVETAPVDRDTASSGSAVVASSAKYTRTSAPDIAIGTAGGRLRGYEYLTDIAVVPNRSLHWPWAVVQDHVSRTAGDDRRGIMLLYNPATERRNGTTHSFFATISSTPPNAPARPVGRGHRHSSVAINYHFEGAGHSMVDGHVVEWKAGDLLLSAPAWSEHAHFIDPVGASVLTIQDHPLQIAMESLIWQERMDGPILTLGSEAGQTGYVGPRVAGA
jgi:gentisate 1,2-dioxygenase